MEHDHVGLGEAEPAHAGGRVEVLGPGEDGPIDGVVGVGVLQPPDVLAEGGRWCSAVSEGVSVAVVALLERVAAHWTHSLSREDRCKNGFRSTVLMYFRPEMILALQRMGRSG